MNKKLIFVYNADSGVFNTLTDIAHKIFSPQTYSCQLCAITHSYFNERDEWREFIDSLPVECEFLHKDEFVRQYPSGEDDFPAVYIRYEKGINVCLTSSQVNQCQSMEQLQHAIRESCID